MTDEITEGGRARAEKAPAAPGAPSRAGPEDRAERSPAPGFFNRYRLPLLLAVVAACLYAGSILYILYGRGQIA